MRGETISRMRAVVHRIFQSTPLIRGETNVYRVCPQGMFYFNPLPSREGRHFLPAQHIRGLDFNPLPSREGRQGRLQDGIMRRGISIHSPNARGDAGALCGLYSISRFQSTPLMRGETDSAVLYYTQNLISIHSPHARGDLSSKYTNVSKSYFNPLPSCEGRHNGFTESHTAIISIHSPHARGDTRCA